jgi:predicted metal-dependent enzyme (double-stranded beta helix superfamily)
MDSVLRRYVSRIREICSEPLSLPARVERIRAAAGEMVAAGVELTPEQRYFPAECYGRNLLWRDPDHGFVVIAMVWPPGTIGAPHDHMTWGVVAVLEGKLSIVNYRRDDDGSTPGKARLTEQRRFDGSPGAIGYVLPPHEDIHEISNPGSELAISIHTYGPIHTYGRDIRRCRCFDRASGDVKFVDLAYHFEGREEVAT